LGSGIGKAVFAAALLGPFERLIGVEIVEQLHITALQVKEIFFAKKLAMSTQESNFIMEMHWNMTFQMQM